MSAADTSPNRRAARSSLAVSCVAYIALGSFTAALGPLLPQLAAQTGSGLAAVGAIFTMISLGGLVSQLLAGPASDRFGKKPVMAIGLALLAIGMLGVVNSVDLFPLLACTVVAGLGYGAADIAINVLIASAFARRSVSALNLLHLFFGIGATLGPAFVSLSVALWSSGLPALWPAIVLPLLLLPPVLRLNMASVHQVPVASASEQQVYRSPVLWTFAGLLGFSVGIEMGVGGWTTAYLMATTLAPVEVAALVTSGYWLAFSAGRVVSTVLGTKLAPATILAMDIALTCLGTVGMVVGIGNWPLSVGATLLVGLGIGSIYPTVMALVTSSFRASPGKAASVIMSSANLATMFLPWLQGLLLTGVGPQSTPWFAAGMAAAMVVLYGLTRRQASPAR